MWQSFKFSLINSVMIAAAPLLAMGACATVVPPFDVPHIQISKEETIPTVGSIVRRIECELIEIAGSRGKGLDRETIFERDIQAVVELSLSVTQDGKLAPNFSFIQAPLTFGTGFSREQSREQNFTTYLTFSLADLAFVNRSSKCDLPADTNLAGTLGLKQFFDLSRSTAPFQKWDETGNSGVFGGSIIFTVESQLAATGPTWKLTTFEGPGPLLSASNKNVDRLTFGFVPGPRAGRRPFPINPYDIINNIKQNQIANSLQLLSNAR